MVVLKDKLIPFCIGSSRAVASENADQVLRIIVQEIDSLAQSEKKGFCTKTANKIKSRLLSGPEVAMEPK